MKQNNMLAMILAGGRGSRLHELTNKVAKPAVSYGGKYRIIDFPLSNCANSGIDNVGVLTQYESILLNSYVAAGRRWGLDAQNSGVYVLPPREKADAKHVEELTGQIKKIAKQPIIMKLTPNVTDITEIAKAAEAGGADAVSLINTLTGMKIDINRKTFAVANKTGGVSGPIVKPIAVRMVYQVAQAVNIPIIGMGGISCAEDAIEFLLAGASAVSVGTANFHNPAVTMEVIDGIEAYMKKNGFESVKDMVGIVK